MITPDWNIVHEYGMAMPFMWKSKSAFQAAVRTLRADAEETMPKGTRIEWRAIDARWDFYSHVAKMGKVAWYAFPEKFNKAKEWDFPMVPFEEIWTIRPQGNYILFGRETL